MLSYYWPNTKVGALFKLLSSAVISFPLQSDLSAAVSLIKASHHLPCASLRVLIIYAYKASCELTLN